MSDRGEVPNIISKEDIKKAAEMVKERKRAPGANKAKELYLFSGLIYCVECGSAV